MFYNGNVTDNIGDRIMGTRFNITIVSDGKIRVAQYGQWDGYFQVVGAAFTQWVRDNLYDKKVKNVDRAIEYFKERVNLCKEAPMEYWETIERAVAPFMVLNDKNDEALYALPFATLLPLGSRDTGVRILDILTDIKPYEYSEGKYFPVILETDVMVQYIYVLDLDNKKVYYLTTDDFDMSKAVQTELPQTLEVYKNDDYKMFYTSDIKNIPSVKILTKVVKELGLY
jgi:hypothetical protein